MFIKACYLVKQVTPYSVPVLGINRCRKKKEKRKRHDKSTPPPPPPPLLGQGRTTRPRVISRHAQIQCHAHHLLNKAKREGRWSVKNKSSDRQLHAEFYMPPLPMAPVATCYVATMQHPTISLMPTMPPVVKHVHDDPRAVLISLSTEQTAPTTKRQDSRSMVMKEYNKK